MSGQLWARSRQPSFMIAFEHLYDIKYRISPKRSSHKFWSGLFTFLYNFVRQFKPWISKILSNQRLLCDFMKGKYVDVPENKLVMSMLIGKVKRYCETWWTWTIPIKLERSFKGKKKKTLCVRSIFSIQPDYLYCENLSSSIFHNWTEYYICNLHVFRLWGIFNGYPLRGLNTMAYIA